MILPLNEPRIFEILQARFSTKYIMRLSELRSNPTLNTKSTALDTIQQYSKQYNNLYVHFGKTNKVGINPNYSYDFTPAGVYAYPASEAIRQLQRGQVHDKYATLIVPSAAAKILDISSAPQSTLDNLMRLAYKLYKSSTGNTDKTVQPFIGFSAQDTWKKIQFMFSSISTDTKNKSFYWNWMIRKLGYNVLRDTNSLISEDVESQIVFLTPNSYKVIHQTQSN